MQYFDSYSNSNTKVTEDNNKVYLNKTVGY